MKIPTRGLGLVAVLILAVAIGAAATWAVQAPRLRDVEVQRERAEEELDGARERISSLEAQLTSATKSQEPVVEEAKEEDAAMPSSGGATASPEDGRHFCFIKSVTRTGAAEITVDYAEFLTGQAAADAASADGEESPPPNDFYISNKNPKLRTFPVNKSMKVKMVSKADDIVMQGYRLPFSAWRDAFNGGAGSFPAIKVVPYWITIQLGVVTAIEEQYIP